MVWLRTRNCKDASGEERSSEKKKSAGPFDIHTPLTRMGRWGYGGRTQGLREGFEISFGEWVPSAKLGFRGERHSVCWKRKNSSIGCHEARREKCPFTKLRLGAPWKAELRRRSSRPRSTGPAEGGES